MSWADLLTTTEAELTLPWTGGRSLVGTSRKWKLSGALPTELGWHRFSVDNGRKARWLGEGMLDLDFADGRRTVRGYLLGDRLVPDGSAVRPDVWRAFQQTEQVWLVEGGLDRFARVLTARCGGRLVYLQQEFPEGPELEVIEAWQDRRENIDHIPGVTPALQLAFLWLVHQRNLAAERRRIQADLARRAEEDARRAAEAAVREQRRREAAVVAGERAQERAELLERHRLSQQRRQSSRRSRQRSAPAVSGDIEAVLEAALAATDSELLDFRPDYNAGQLIVQFRFRRRRFECVVNAQTLQIVDSGICLTDDSTGEKGDTRFTLESLPVVISSAMDQGVLHVYRHVR
ncbi:MAG: hypothetical protein ACI8RZ_006890 [Myxococcota bacterium]|jgi:hypothetical protein